MRPFAERLKERALEKRTALCVGLDPRLHGPPPFLAHEISREGRAEALREWSFRMIAAAAPHAVAVKPQSAFYEAEGLDGWRILAETVTFARNRGLLVVLDAKRGDISSTMKAYGQAAFDHFGADALTITPYMGKDVLEPLLPWLTKGRGVYVVWITSNPDGDLVQKSTAGDLLTHMERSAEGGGASESLGFVLGATKVQGLAEDLWSRAVGYPLLLPGIGPQGGVVGSRLKTLLAGTREARVGVPLIPMSRAVAGLGDPDQENRLAGIRNWDEYQAYVEEKVRIAAQVCAV